MKRKRLKLVDPATSPAEVIPAEIAAAPGPTQVIPANIADFLGKPSLLQTEVAADYDALLLWLAETVNPKDAVEWIWVADVTNLVWEMRRLRSIRDNIVENKIAGALDELAEDILGTGHSHLEKKNKKEQLIAQWNSGDASRREVVGRFLKTGGADLSQVYAVAYRRRLDEFSKLEGLIANLGRRRDSVLREIERRRDTVARRLRDVTDAEFETIKPGTQSVDN